MIDGALLVQALAMGALLVLSSFFSGSETAFFSLNSLEKDSLRRRTHGATGTFVERLFSHPDEVLVTILTGNMFVNIFASSLSEAIGAAIFQQAAELLSIVSMTVILLVVGEMTPKNLAMRHSLRFAGFSARILRHLFVVLRPLTYPLGLIRHAVVSRYPGRARDDEAHGEAVLSAIRMGYQNKTIGASELRLLERFFRFRDKTAADVMVPRVDSAPVDAAMTIGDYIREAVRADQPAARLVALYRDDVDHIIGYMRRSDLIVHRLVGTTNRPLSDLKRTIHAVPTSKDLRELLDEMSELNTEMAIVVDEYGGTEGLVSFPAVMAYLFGDFAASDEQTVHVVDESTWRLAGQLEIGEAEAVLGVELPQESRSIGGMVIDLLGDLPHEGASVTVSGLKFTVEHVTGRRIAWILVRKAAGE